LVLIGGDRCALKKAASESLIRSLPNPAAEQAEMFSGFTPLGPDPIGAKPENAKVLPFASPYL
jgi:hypothetical protein